MNERMIEKGFMFDTNIFNKILDGGIKTKLFAGFQLYATHIQHDELSRAERRNELLTIFAEISPQRTSTATSVWDVSNWDESEWGNDADYQRIKSKLDARKKEKQNIQDSLIAITAIEKELILVTDDINLREIVNEFGGKSIGLKEFLNLTKKVLNNE